MASSSVERTVIGMAARALWPSVKRACSSLLSAFSLPLLLLAAISAAKLLRMIGLMEPQGWFAEVVGWQSHVIDYLRDLLEAVRIVVPFYWFDIALFYFFVGNAVARAEQDELLTVELDEGTAWATFKNAVKSFRADYFFYSIPMRLRGIALRLFWPLAAVYRVGTPWVVDGPGPDGTDISSSVRRGEILKFAQMIHKGGNWSQQTVFDHRMVLLFQITFGIAASLALQTLSKLL